MNGARGTWSGKPGAAAAGRLSARWSPWSMRGRRFIRPPRDRRGAAMVEMAIVGPLAFLLLIGLIVGCLGVFRYNQVASLAHEAVRWAAVRGSNFERIHRRSPITAEDVFENVIAPRAAGINRDRLNCTMERDQETGVVSITVTYRWIPEGYFRNVTMSNTAMMIVSN